MDANELHLGTAAMTTRGFTEQDSHSIALIVSSVIVEAGLLDETKPISEIIIRLAKEVKQLMSKRGVLGEVDGARLPLASMSIL